MNQTVSDYVTTYSSMTDEQLLNLAQDRESLRPEAAIVFNTELAKRKLGQEEIEKQAQCVQRGQLDICEGSCQSGINGTNSGIARGVLLCAVQTEWFTL